MMKRSTYIYSVIKECIDMDTDHLLHATSLEEECSHAILKLLPTHLTSILRNSGGPQGAGPEVLDQIVTMCVHICGRFYPSSNLVMLAIRMRQVVEERRTRIPPPPPSVTSPLKGGEKKKRSTTVTAAGHPLPAAIVPILEEKKGKEYTRMERFELARKVARLDSPRQMKVIHLLESKKSRSVQDATEVDVEIDFALLEPELCRELTRICGKTQT
jgi:hypothetical protein